MTSRGCTVFLVLFVIVIILQSADSLPSRDAATSRGSSRRQQPSERDQLPVSTDDVLIIIIIIIIIPRQCLWCCHRGRAIARVHPVHLMNVERCQAAADPRPSQTTSAASPPVVQAARIYTHHRHLLLLLSPKADTHFTVPRRLEG